jgi:alpha-beta hydrolase superfamily lysophospholipase
MQRDFSSFADSILILHGTEDEIVPFEEAKGFAEKNGIRFIPVEGGDHRLLNPGGMDFAVKMMLEHFGFE